MRVGLQRLGHRGCARRSDTIARKVERLQAAMSATVLPERRGQRPRAIRAELVLREADRRQLALVGHVSGEQDSIDLPREVRAMEGAP